MKKVILTAIAALAFMVTSFAQEAATPVAKPKTTKIQPPAKRAAGQGNGQGALNALGLSPEQETQFKAINKAHKAAVDAVKSNESLAKEAKKAQVAELMAKYQSDVQGIMNADQFAKWTAAREARKEAGNPKADIDPKTDPSREGTEGYEGPANTNTTPVDPNKKRQPKKPTGKPMVKPSGN
jgi:Spy/CpxP family protein refolding chaperone